MDTPLPRRLTARLGLLAMVLVGVAVVDPSATGARDIESVRPSLAIPPMPSRSIAVRDATPPDGDGCPSGHACLAQAPGFGGADAGTLKPIVVPVGKWPEGLAASGPSIWVAESGLRRIARVDTRTNQVAETVTVGRLPVDMAVGPEGNLYGLVNTDKTVFLRTPDGKNRRLATFTACPERFAARTGMLLVLVQPDCSSATARVLGVDTGKGTVRSSPELGPNANAIAAVGDAAWVVHSTGSVQIVDAATLQPAGSIPIGGFPWVIASNGGAVFVAGREAQQRGSGMVVRVDAATRRETQRRVLPGTELMAAIAADDRHVVAVGPQGTVFVLSAADLAPLRRFTAAGFGEFQPQAVLIANGRLYITTHKGQGENGSLLVFEGWQP